MSMSAMMLVPLDAGEVLESASMRVMFARYAMCNLPQPTVFQASVPDGYIVAIRSRDPVGPPHCALKWHVSATKSSVPMPEHAPFAKPTHDEWVSCCRHLVPGVEIEVYPTENAYVLHGFEKRWQ